MVFDQLQQISKVDYHSLIAFFVLMVALLCGYPSSYKPFLVAFIFSGKAKVFVNQKVRLVSYQVIIMSTSPRSFSDGEYINEEILRITETWTEKFVYSNEVY